MVRPPQRITTKITLLRYKNSPCPGFAAFQTSFATIPRVVPASIPKLKQALNTPDTMATNKPIPILNSLPEASVLAPLNSLSFIAPALPQMMIPITQTASPNNTSCPQEVPTKFAMVSLPSVGV